jgi:hypothetical protein
MKQAPALAALLSITAALLGCVDAEAQPVVHRCTDPDVIEQWAPTRPDFPLVRQSEHLDIYADKGWSVCAGTALDLERHVVFVAEQLGIEDLRTHIPFYYTYNLPKGCSPGAIGCAAPDGAAYAVAGATYHELTHAVACQLRNNASSTFTEGLASMFGQFPHGHESYADQFDGDIADLLVATPTQYDYASHFVRWLIEHEGGPAFAEVYTRSHSYPRPEIDDIAALMEDVYGRTVTELAADYAATAPFAWVPVRQCADVPHVSHVAAHPDEWRLEGVFDCDDERTMGPYEGPYALFAEDARKMMYQSLIFTVEAPGTFSVEITGADHVNFARCAERHAESEEEQSWLFDTTSASLIPEFPTPRVKLIPGLWRADVMQYQTLPGPYEVVIRPAEELP